MDVQAVHEKRFQSRQIKVLETSNVSMVVNPVARLQCLDLSYEKSRGSTGAKNLMDLSSLKNSLPQNMERTYIMVKPDGVQRGLVGEIMARFEKRGYQLLGAKLASPSKEHLEQHYADLAGKPFFPGLVSFMSSGPVMCLCFAGKDAVKTGRKILGETNPLASLPGTIRGDFGIDIGRNICHGSDSVESAEKEIALWFPEGVLSYTKVINQWIYE